MVSFSCAIVSNDRARAPQVVIFGGLVWRCKSGCLCMEDTRFIVCCATGAKGCKHGEVTLYMVAFSGHCLTLRDEEVIKNITLMEAGS
jgi:hypothetical protein